MFWIDWIQPRRSSGESKFESGMSETWSMKHILLTLNIKVCREKTNNPKVVFWVELRNSAICTQLLRSCASRRVVLCFLSDTYRSPKFCMLKGVTVSCFSNPVSSLVHRCLSTKLYSSCYEADCNIKGISTRFKPKITTFKKSDITK